MQKLTFKKIMAIGIMAILFSIISIGMADENKTNIDAMNETVTEIINNSHSLKGPGSAYACINEDGYLYRSNMSCV